MLEAEAGPSAQRPAPASQVAAAGTDHRQIRLAKCDLLKPHSIFLPALSAELVTNMLRRRKNGSQSQGMSTPQAICLSAEERRNTIFQNNLPAHMGKLSPWRNIHSSGLVSDSKTS